MPWLVSMAIVRAGDSKSGLPPIIGAVLGNSNRSSKLNGGLSSSTDHKNSSRLHETKKAVKRKSKGRIFDGSSHRYQGQQGAHRLSTSTLLRP